ncbi:MAG: glycosyltransferase [Lachnospiraceae bacterium]|nr:glycosyltransferase [Lachnospiraceae bacterium]
MKISVCMGLYNGAKYIQQQLQTIYEQSVRPDEVILCDDGSKDSTVEIVKSFIKSNNLQDSWKVYCNEVNKGYPDNFYYAMSLCGGDVVFLADQDDLWHKDKIKVLSEHLEANRDTKCVCCKFELVDEAGANIHTVMAPTTSGESKAARQVTIEDVFYKCEWPGMVMAYRNEWYKSWAPVEGETKIPHDFLVCARASEENGFVQLDETLAYHRRHENNTGGEEHRISRLLNKERKLKEIEDYLKILEDFQKDVLATERGKNALEDKLTSMQGRYEALKSGKVIKVLGNAWRNRKQTRVATVVCDVVICKGE